MMPTLTEVMGKLTDQADPAQLDGMSEGLLTAAAAGEGFVVADLAGTPDIPVNASFSELTNYTIYTNDTAGNIANLSL